MRDAVFGADQVGDACCGGGGGIGVAFLGVVGLAPVRLHDGAASEQTLNRFSILEVTFETYYTHNVHVL